MPFARSRPGTERALRLADAPAGWPGSGSVPVNATHEPRYADAHVRANAAGRLGNVAALSGGGDEVGA